jgi:hypothetical protein
MRIIINQLIAISCRHGLPASRAAFTRRSVSSTVPNERV